MEALGDVGKVGGQAIVTVRNLDGIFKPPGHYDLVGVIHTAADVEIPPLPPFHEDIVDCLPILLGGRVGVADVDLHRVAGQADNIPHRFGRPVAARGYHPRQGAYAGAAELKWIHAGRSLGVEGGVADPTLASASRHADGGLAGAANGHHVGISAGVVLKFCAGGEGCLHRAGLIGS